MRKLALSLAVVVAFVVYSYHERHELATAVVVRRSRPTTTQTTPPSPTPTTPPDQQSTSPGYKDGTYTGSVADAFYGNIQVQAMVRGGKLVDIAFLQHPNDNPTSRAINAQADPLLAQEAIQAQQAQVDVISGATDTSLAFVQSLTAALSNAR